MKRMECPISRIAHSSRKNNVALSDSSNDYSYLLLNQFIHSVQEKLISSGIKKGSKVILHMDNSVSCIVYYFALLRLQAVSCFLNSRIPQEVLAASVKAFNAKFIVTHSRKIKINGLTYLSAQIPKKMTSGEEGVHFDLTATSNLMKTSGSTAFPKIVVHTIANHYYSAIGSNEHISIKVKDKWLLSLPLYHVAGLGILWRVFIAGGTIIVKKRTDTLKAIIQKHKPTHFSLVCTQLSELLKNTSARKVLKEAKCVLVGGSAVHDELIERSIKCEIPLYITYGLTEMSSQVYTSVKVRTKRDAKKGICLNYSQVRIDRQQNIWVKGKVLFKGYLRAGRIQKSVDAKGWFKTGDVGVKNKLGGITVLGRSDNMFISGGENMYPEEIEKALLNIMGIKKAAVIPVNSKKFGTRPIAYLSIDKNSGLTRKYIEKQLSNQIEKIKYPDEYYKWPQSLSAQGIKVNKGLFKTIKTNLKNELFN